VSTAPAVAVRSATIGDYAELTKPRITTMVMFTALVGFVLASPPGSVRVAGLVSALVGVGLVAAGASALNMLLERHTDARMLRTRQRPLPAGRLRPVEAAGFGVLLTGAGLAHLTLFSGPLSAWVAFATWASYVFLYTPLKTRTSLATIVGAVPGALPPVIGWAAARGTLDPGAWVLFAILFLWQIPHFLAIAWLYREDYARGGLPMLPVVDPDGRLTGRQAVAHSLALLIVSLAPGASGMAGGWALAGAAVCGLLLTAVAVRLAVRRTLPAARELFLASLVYLPAVSLLLVLDRG
jgi:protoheme IX farnesyltransferase